MYANSTRKTIGNKLLANEKREHCMHLMPLHIPVPTIKTDSILYSSKLVYIEALKLIDNLNCSTDIIAIWWFHLPCNFECF